MSEPFEITFHPGREHVSVKVFGRATGEVIARVMAIIYSDQRWKKNLHVVWDLTTAEGLHFEWDDFEQLIAMDADLSDVVGNGRDLILVRSDLHEAVVESYAVLAKKSNRKALVFRSATALQAALESPQKSE